MAWVRSPLQRSSLVRQGLQTNLPWGAFCRQQSRMAHFRTWEFKNTCKCKLNSNTLPLTPKYRTQICFQTNADIGQPSTIVRPSHQVHEPPHPNSLTELPTPSAPPLSVFEDFGGARASTSNGSPLEKTQSKDEFVLLCSICMDVEKNTRIDPCGHTGCRDCLMAVKKEGMPCPFCRVSMKALQPFFLWFFNHKDTNKYVEWNFLKAFHVLLIN